MSTPKRPRHMSAVLSFIPCTMLIHHRAGMRASRFPVSCISPRVALRCTAVAMGERTPSETVLQTPHPIVGPKLKRLQEAKGKTEESKGENDRAGVDEELDEGIEHALREEEESEEQTQMEVMEGNQQEPVGKTKGRKKAGRKRGSPSAETRAKISYKMLGVPKTPEMKEKVSRKLKGRVPWNKGKKMSAKTRDRMSQARRGKVTWNKGRILSQQHREHISDAMKFAYQHKVPTASSIWKRKMARRRPGDALVAGNSGVRTEDGSYPLVEGSEINVYISLRKELRTWSNKFFDENQRRPSLADVRRIASTQILRKFETYIKVRDSIRGLASDVYGNINPQDIPTAPVGDSSSSPRNNSQNVIHLTKHGNPRLVSTGMLDSQKNTIKHDGAHAFLEGTAEDMWDSYDRPERYRKNNKEEEHTSLIGIHEMKSNPDAPFCPNDYRIIGKYRLMETIEINRYLSLRKELQEWSELFREKIGRTPTLSDAQRSEKPGLYHKFCQYLEMRNAMGGLVQEVIGAEIDDAETINKVNTAGKQKLQALREAALEDIGE